MKKYDEGYALPFVLVVFLVFSLIATSVLTFSLKNLQSQQASIQRTKDQYAAQGEIEKACVLLINDIEMFGSTIDENYINSNIFNKESQKRVDVVCESAEYNVETGVLTVKMNTASGGLAEIYCEVEIERKDNNVLETTYKSYTVTTNGGAGS